MLEKTNELTGAALDWAVAVCEGLLKEPFPFGVGAPARCGYNFSTDWSLGGPIIEREKIRLDCPWPDSWNAQHKHSAKIDGVIGWVTGDTPLVAAMRCYVASKMGDEVEIPKED